MKKTPFKRKAPITRIRLTPIRTLKRKAWTVISLYIRARDRHCVTCKVKPAEQCGHYKHNTDKINNTLGGNALWYDERNYGGQCAGCNKYKSGAPREFAIHLEETHGHGILQELHTLFHTSKKWKREEVIAVTESYQTKLEALSTPIRDGM